MKAIQKMKEPTRTAEVGRFLGMANQMSKFTAELAEKASLFATSSAKAMHGRDVTNNSRRSTMSKKALSSSPTLALYDPTKEIVVSTDVSLYGLGEVLQKQPDGELLPVAYISRTLTSIEQRYAQIEKEALAITSACERFSDYLVGMTFHVHTDHKPLVPLLGPKNLDELHLRIQRFKMRFSFTISHVPGRDLTTADVLSRAPLATSSTEDDQLRQGVQICYG